MLIQSVMKCGCFLGPGPVWKRFKDHLHGRIVQNKDEGGTGVIVGRMNNKIKVR